MPKLKTEFLPEATLAVFNRLKNDHRLSGFTLVGGTALTLHIGHRISEDLDFNIFGQQLPLKCIDGVLDQLAADGLTIESLITPEQKSRFKINSSQNLDHYVQDYLINGAKVTFHSRNENERPRQQIDFLKSTQKTVVSEAGFDVMGIDGLFVMKSIVVYDRVKSRDIYDLMVLTRDHGYTLEDAFTAIAAYQPIRNKDPEHFKSVVTGLTPLDKGDEGFSSINLHIKLEDLYKYFRKLVNDFEIRVVGQLRPNA